MAEPVKKLYAVHVPSTVTYTIIVEADDDQQAIERAKDELKKDPNQPHLPGLTIWAAAETQELKPTLPFNESR